MKKYCLILGLLLLLAGKTSAEDNGLLALLQDYDNLFLADYSVDLKVTQPTGIMPEDGMSTCQVSLTGRGGSHRMKLARQSRDAVSFVQNPSIGGKTKEGEYVVGYYAEQAIELTPNKCKVRNDPKVVVVNPASGDSGQDGRAQSLVEVYPPNHHDAYNLYFRYILPLGRGYARHLTEVTSVEDLGDGISALRGIGTFFSDKQGEWYLEVDTAHDCLVRKASFRQYEHAMPMVLMESSGLSNHDLPLFSHGTIKIAQYEITVDLNNASFNENENVKREVASRINDMPEFERGAKVMDFTRMDSRKVPRMLELEAPK